MKHINSISRGVPSKADEWQDIVCIIANFLASFLPEGTLPLVDFVDDKCDLPQPNP